MAPSGAKPTFWHRSDVIDSKNAAWSGERWNAHRRTDSLTSRTSGLWLDERRRRRLMTGWWTSPKQRRVVEIVTVRSWLRLSAMIFFHSASVKNAFHIKTDSWIWYFHRERERGTWMPSGRGLRVTAPRRPSFMPLHTTSGHGGLETNPSWVQARERHAAPRAERTLRPTPAGDRQSPVGRERTAAPTPTGCLRLSDGSEHVLIVRVESRRWIWN